MNITCVTEKIETVIAKATRVTGKNITLPILQCVYIEAKNNTLTIRATNLDLGIEYMIPVKVIEEGSVAVPGGILSSFLSHLNDKNITMKTSEGVLIVETDTNKTQIKTYNSDDFPAIPRSESDTSFSIKGETIATGIRSVSYSAATSNIKPELSSVYISPNEENNQLLFTATDSFRLAEKKFSVKDLPSFSYILLPVKNTGEIVRVLEEQKNDVVVTIDTNQITFSGDGVYITSRTIDGVFPDYQQIIPDPFSTEVTLLRSDLMNALKISHIFTDKFNKVILSVDQKNNLLSLQTKNAEVGENTQSLDGVVSGEEITATFNHKYIMDSFQSLTTDSIILQFSGEGKPMVIRGVSDKSFLYLVMPMNQ